MCSPDLPKQEKPKPEVDAGQVRERLAQRVGTRAPATIRTTPAGLLTSSVDVMRRQVVNASA